MAYNYSCLDSIIDEVKDCAVGFGARGGIRLVLQVQRLPLGTGDGKFSPNDNCLRAQIVTFLYRAYSEE